MVCNECYNTLNRTAGNCECVCLYKYIEVGRTGLFRCKFTCARRARTFSGLFGRVKASKAVPHLCVCSLSSPPSLFPINVCLAQCVIKALN